MRSKSFRVDIMPVQRQARILEYLRMQGAASVSVLASDLGASLSTIRRDLEQLAEEGLIERHHGGAVIRAEASARFEPSTALTEETHRTEKDMVGALAAQLVASGETVIFDSSSTVLAAARHILGLNVALTAITNDLRIASILKDAPNVETIVSGGKIRPASATLMGHPGLELLASIHADIAFIGVHAITGRRFSETSLDVAAIKQRMISAARRVIVLADSSKFGPPSFAAVCDASQVDIVITDSRASELNLKELRGAGVKCLIAGSTDGA